MAKDKLHVKVDILRNNYRNLRIKRFCGMFPPPPWFIIGDTIPP
jgi:hypothetical protein